ncbi:MAG TPA: glycosyltransferase family 4 protein [bacterium]|nr:glycosyltransferase family 4 protein [bacterium]
MKIAFIGQKGIPAISGGVERHVEDLAVRLAAQGHEVIAYTRPHYTDPLLTEYKGVRLISLPSIATKSLDAISHTFLACFDIIRLQVDIIHFHSIGPSSLIWLAKLLNPRVKIISTFHSRDYFQEKWGLGARLYLKFGEWMACRAADTTIAISKSLANSAEADYGRKVEYVPNGVAEVSLKAADKINKWGLVKDNYILTVARLIPNKSIHHLIEAYKQLATDKKLVIVGGSAFTETYETYLKELAADNPDIIFTDSQSGDILAELYSNTCLFVQCSELEGLSIALLEAMAYGKGILVSDIPENIEAISNTGKTFKVKNTEDLLKQLQWCLEEKEVMSNLGRAAQERALTTYNWDLIVKETENIYIALLAEKYTSRNTKLLAISRFWTLI